MSRMFVGSMLSDEAKRGAGEVLKKLQKKHWKVRWVPLDTMHVTWVFLGEVADEEKAVEVLRSIGGGKPIRLRFKGLSSFPAQKMATAYRERMHGRSMRRVRVQSRPQLTLPRILYLRLGGELKRLHTMVSQIRQALHASGVEYDQKPFTPHVTLGRVEKSSTRGERIEMAKMVRKLFEMDIPQEWKMTRVSLFASRLTKNGPLYSERIGIQLR